MSPPSRYIKRNLSYTDEKHKTKLISEKELLSCDRNAIVVLGEPGMGKTRLLHELENQFDGKFTTAISFLRQSHDQIPKDMFLIIDGLDEIATVEDGDPLHKVLRCLNASGNPPFIISCRSAEWDNVVASIDIQDEYGFLPFVLTLEPLSNDDVEEFLTEALGNSQAKKTLNQFELAGLELLLHNPLNLEFVISIVKNQCGVPTSRSELLNQATKVLCEERNIRHRRSSHTLAQLPVEGVLDAAGEVMAIALITGKSEISIEAASEEKLYLPELGSSSNIEMINASLRHSRLFRTTNDKVFTPIHRTVAEFLGARWLAKEIENHQYQHRTAMRFLHLISHEAGVPASLRGLHAWLPKFSPQILGPMVIDQDPYGILRYADGDSLSVTQAKRLIQNLRQFWQNDPQFQDYWWERNSVRALVQVELVDEIQSIICNSDEREPLHLRVLLLKAVKEGDIAKQLSPTLETILLDSKREFVERSLAGEALCQIVHYNNYWTDQIKLLSGKGDYDSTRLAVDLITEVGAEKFEVEQIAMAIIAFTGILTTDLVDREDRHYGFLLNLQRNIKGIPQKRISELLDELAKVILKLHDPMKWWETDYHKDLSTIADFAIPLISTILNKQTKSIEPEQIWFWIRALWSGWHQYPAEHKSVCQSVCDNNNLRIGIQRLALFEPDTEEHFHDCLHRLTEICTAFTISKDDARIHLSELVKRNHSGERIRWIYLIETLRSGDCFIPAEIQEIAKPYAMEDQELMNLLVEQPKVPESTESQKRYRRSLQTQKIEQQEQLNEIRTRYAQNIDVIRRGALPWILNPAKAYLGMFRNLRNDLQPSERISAWLGEVLKDAVLEGFEATLNRKDLPSTGQIATDFSQSKASNFAFPMIAAAGERYLNGTKFDDLPYDLISALGAISDNGLQNLEEHLTGLNASLYAELRKDKEKYQAHLRRMIEPILESNSSHITGLYRLTHQDFEQPNLLNLGFEWLERYPNLPLRITRELIYGVFRAISGSESQISNRLATLSKVRLQRTTTGSDEEKFWRSVQFSVDFETAIFSIPNIKKQNRDLLWSLTQLIYRPTVFEGEWLFPVQVAQLKWLVSNFRYHWPKYEIKPGLSMGSTNPEDATVLIIEAINRISKEPSNEARSALTELREMDRDGYTNYVLSAIAANNRKRITEYFVPPSLSDLKKVLSNGSPISAADVQAIVLDKLIQLQERLRGDDKNPVNNFYDHGKPRNEIECCNQLLILLHELPFGIQSKPEVIMPKKKRSDAAFTYGAIEIPMETKGQWHKSVWNAATTQLDRFYIANYRSASKGIYIVFWFGKDAPKGKRIKRPPHGLMKPETPEDMQIALQLLIPLERRADVAVFVLDVTKT